MGIVQAYEDEYLMNNEREKVPIAEYDMKTVLNSWNIMMSLQKCDAGLSGVL